MPQFLEIHIENTNACGYRCAMCPRDLQTRPLGYMSLSDFSLLLERLGPFAGDFHLHGFGEPLLDRQLGQKIRPLKEVYPHSKAQIFSTLGVPLKEGRLLELIEAGLDVLGISLYGFNREEYRNIHGFDGFELVKKNLLALSPLLHKTRSFQAMLKVPSATMATALPLVGSAEKRTFCQWAEELGFTIHSWAYVHNYGDGRHYNAPQQGRVCPVIEGRRKEILNITWNLDVIPCCYDFNATMVFGNLRENTLAEIFSSPAYFQFLLAHKIGDLSAYPVCQNCEKNDYE